MHIRFDQPAQQPTQLLPGPPRPASYSKRTPLGKGAFGAVFLVRHDETGEQNVLKEVALRGLSTKELRRSRDEVEVLRKLRHPHLISYRHAFLISESATLCIVMEYAAGGDLQKRIEAKLEAKGRFQEPEVLKWLYQSCSALAYCHHDLHLLHRDLKPANVFLSAAGDVKIGDFGISKSLAASAALATTKCGSPLFMSPELCQGRSYDRGADVWALGCTFYQVCSLKPPWLDQVPQKGGPVALYRTICTQALDLQRLRAHYSFELCALFSSFLAKAAAQRPSFKLALATPFMQKVMAAVDPVAAAAALAATHGTPPPPPPAALPVAPQPAAPPPPPVGAPAAAPAAALLPADFWVVKEGEVDGGDAALGTDAHAAAAVLQRSFHRHHRPMGYSAALAQHQLLNRQQLVEQEKARRQIEQDNLRRRLS